MVIEYHEAAFNHHVSEADIEWALATQFYEKPAADGSFLAIGFNRAGNPLEVAFRELDDRTLFVFHAMPCRQQWLDEANTRKKHGQKTD
ncbi:MAG: hypothetical protein LBI90_08920 [Treponema sp.]|nr:hypothetical protein [Treponema sp.]